MKSNRFQIHELTPINLYKNLHEDLLWSMLDDGLLETIDKIKEVFPLGTMTCNNYHWGGDRGWSGIRTKDSKYYSRGSQHSIGKACDFVFSAYTAKEVRDYIIENQDEFPYIGGIEMGTDWLHIDSRAKVNGKIKLFYPG